MTVALLLAAVVGGWFVQLLLTHRQATAFTNATRHLRSRGAVAVGTGGRRYRGGVAFVAIAVDPQGAVADAITLRGWTTFARPGAMPELLGQRLSALCGPKDIAGLRANERDAVRHAATTIRDSRRSRPAEGATTVTSSGTAKAPAMG